MRKKLSYAMQRQLGDEAKAFLSAVALTALPSLTQSHLEDIY